MALPRTLKVRQIKKLLRDNGWEYVNTEGDHHHFEKDGRKITVVGNDGDEMRGGTLSHLLKNAGLR